MALANEAGAHVRGTVAFRGKVPIAETKRVTVDTELCGKEALVQTVQVNTDTLGLRHVVVSVKGIASPRYDGAGPKRIIVNAQCAFEPRVAAGRVGDTLEIQNLDPILHNTHVVVGKKTIVNVAQVAGSRPIPKTLKRAGLYVLRCDKHTFMTGALQVFDHPYFAVTDEFGAFQIPPLPAGSYTIVVWHETLGSLEQEIIVPSQGMVTINFEYSS
jgi:plastocyanin